MVQLYAISGRSRILAPLDDTCIICMGILQGFGTHEELQGYQLQGYFGSYAMVPLQILMRLTALRGLVGASQARPA